MADHEAQTGKTNIPLLTKTNFLQWSLRMLAYLRHLTLSKYVLEPPLLGLAGAAAAAVATKHAEVVHILMNHIHETVFETVVTPDIAEDPHAIWESIRARFASASVNNKG
ncbi:hypothetical protein KEM48_002444 [Puccinia striiformis f. sp. tritici PST-130]|nr:hypothetical protein KEM48_002444 [Puccinia striiformis f. sp. tritici PST-130]